MRPHLANHPTANSSVGPASTRIDGARPIIPFRPDLPKTQPHQYRSMPRGPGRRTAKIPLRPRSDGPAERRLQVPGHRRSMKLWEWVGMGGSQSTLATAFGLPGGRTGGIGGGSEGGDGGGRREPSDGTAPAIGGSLRPRNQELPDFRSESLACVPRGFFVRVGAVAFTQPAAPHCSPERCRPAGQKLNSRSNERDTFGPGDHGHARPPSGRNWFGPGTADLPVRRSCIGR